MVESAVITRRPKTVRAETPPPETNKARQPHKPHYVNLERIETAAPETYEARRKHIPNRILADAPTLNEDDLAFINDLTPSEGDLTHSEEVASILEAYRRWRAMRESNSENTTGNKLELGDNPPAAIPHPAPETPPPETCERFFVLSGNPHIIEKGVLSSEEEAALWDEVLRDLGITESNSENTTGNKLGLDYNPPAAIPRPAPELPAAPVERQDENPVLDELDVNGARAKLLQFIAFEATAEQLAKVARVLAPENTPSIGETARAAATQETKRAVNTSALGVRVKTEWLPVSELTEDQRTARREYQKKKKQRWRARQAAKATASPSP